MTQGSINLFGARDSFRSGQGIAYLYRLDRLEKIFGTTMSRLPFSIRILLESALRNCDDRDVTEADVERLARWTPRTDATPIPFKPARVIMQDHSGIPCLLDFAAMREAIQKVGGDPKKINPLVPVDLVIDHSVQVDFFGSVLALRRNTETEFTRNRERYEFLRWAAKAFRNFRVVPPATGIIHQVNLEYLAQGVLQYSEGDSTVIFPETVVGTDSHTTMINALGIVGWGIGGIEAESVMLGQQLSLLMPQVVGVKLSGQLREGVTATDLTLTITQLLREKNVVDKFVEFCGAGLGQISLPDRASIANMAPEYGATMGFFPVDEEAIRYLRGTGRATQSVDVENYYKEQGLFRTDETVVPLYSEVIDFDLSTVLPSLAGPRRPYDRVPLADVKLGFERSLIAPARDGGYGLAPDAVPRRAAFKGGDDYTSLDHGSVVIAAITSCTNTSNPSVMLCAGLLARKALERGLTVKPFVKTSMAPGSKVVGQYLAETGLLGPLQMLGFNIVGYGCSSCIGNSGPLPAEVAKQVVENDLVVAAVISGNRNFEGRVHPLVKATYLASPPLVVAYALAGNVNVDLSADPLGIDRDGQCVYLRGLWPTAQEIRETIATALKPQLFMASYKNIWDGNEMWNTLPAATGDLYQWDPTSTYILEPPFFQDVALDLRPIHEILDARVLVKLGDSVTTDHISPAGDIALDSPAARYLLAHNVEKKDFNHYGTRRGNHLVMTRGTFANVRLRNQLVPGVEGGITLHLPSGEQMTIFDAAERYGAERIPLIVLAGKEYGMGSSRDWAAKGTRLLGVKAVIAGSYERIHRSNLVGMAVLPLQYKDGQTADSLGLTGRETFAITGITAIRPRGELAVSATREDGTTTRFSVIARLDTLSEVEYYQHGGILPKMLRGSLFG